MSYLENSREQMDLVRPGEQWFFYWKTSAALWESKIVQFPIHETIFIPLYWGFHAETATQWDFGHIQPERDLKRLTTILTQHKRKFCWILPLTPAPFLPNGGLPVSVARTLSISVDGVHIAILDHELKLNKMYSFFDPKVFQVFTSFLTSFKKFVSSAKIEAPIWGGNFFYREDQGIVSYMTDTSVAFEQGFSRYLKQNQPEGVNLTHPLEEEKLKHVFTQDVMNLFQTTAADVLAPLWKGVQAITVLGGSPKDTIERSCPSGKSQIQYFKDIFDQYVHDQLMSSVLLHPKEKKDLLQLLIDEHFSGPEIDERYHYHLQSGQLSEEFRPFHLVYLFSGKNTQHFAQTGLVPYLDKYFRWLYLFHSQLNFSTDWIESHHDKIKFFHGASLDRTRFAQMLKLFMMGQKVVLDTSGLHSDLEKRLQIFYLENNLKLQTVNFQTEIQISEIGEGRFITINGERLKTSGEQGKFWTQLFRYLTLNQPLVHMEDQVFSLWRVRATSSHELNYLDVRRINLYNPTSYKKHITIDTQKHFAFMKMIDPVKAHAKSTTNGVEIELLPNGKIALDFGHYEEN